MLRGFSPRSVLWEVRARSRRAGRGAPRSSGVERSDLCQSLARGLVRSAPRGRAPRGECLMSREHLAPADFFFFEFRCFFLAYARRISLLDAVRTRPFWLKVGALNLQPYDAGSSPARVVFANNVFAEESWAATALAKTF